MKAAKAASSSSKPDQASVSHFKNKKKVSLRHVSKHKNLTSNEIFNDKDQNKKVVENQADQQNRFNYLMERAEVEWKSQISTLQDKLDNINQLRKT